jgi:hypothetical protein
MCEYCFERKKIWPCFWFIYIFNQTPFPFLYSNDDLGLCKVRCTSLREETCSFEFKVLILWVLLTRISGILVKESKRSKFYIEKN